MGEIGKNKFLEHGDVEISEIGNGIYRISGFDDAFGITFNQFLIDDEQPTLIHTAPLECTRK